jgi:hypothetical protein
LRLQAKVVNQNGVIQADSVQNENGVVELVASDSLNLGADSQILARGDNSSVRQFRRQRDVEIGKYFSDSQAARLSRPAARMAATAADVEISAPNISSLNSAR